MRKLFVLVLATLMLLTSCQGGEVTEGGGDAAVNPYDEKTATQLLELMRPSVEAEQLTVFVDPLPLNEADAFEYHFFIKVSETIENAAICQPNNSVIPFFLGILKVSSEGSARQIAEDIEDNINYHKLVCTSFEKAHVKVVGKTVFLALDGDAERADRMLARFEGLFDQG